MGYAEVPLVDETALRQGVLEVMLCRVTRQVQSYTVRNHKFIFFVSKLFELLG